jgi:polysaccharide biosynthesis/export protein
MLAAVLLAGCSGSSGNAGNAAFTATTPSAMLASTSTQGKAGVELAPLPLTPADRVAARRAAAGLTEVAKPGSTAYLIGPLDVLDVSVFKVPDLSKSVQVADTGTINLPLVGEVKAAGRTARDVEQDLTQQLGGKFLQNPQVTVFVKEYNSQRVTLEGAVKKPGVFPIQGKLSLLQSLALAQGLDVNADGMVVVFRDDGGQRTAAKFDVGAIRAGTGQDPMLMAGDVVVANNSATKEAFNNIIKALPIASLFGGL